MVLSGDGSQLVQVVFARVYLTNFERDYAAMNAIYQSYFAPGRLPARTCIGVTGLAGGGRVELDLLSLKAHCGAAAALRFTGGPSSFSARSERVLAPLPCTTYAGL